MRALTDDEKALRERQGPCSCPYWPDHSCPDCEEYDTRESFNAECDMRNGRSPVPDYRAKQDAKEARRAEREAKRVAGIVRAKEKRR